MELNARALPAGGAVPVRRFLLGVFFGLERVGLRRAVGSTSAGGTRSELARVRDTFGRRCRRARDNPTSMEGTASPSGCVPRHDGRCGGSGARSRWAPDRQDIALPLTRFGDGRGGWRVRTGGVAGPCGSSRFATGGRASAAVLVAGGLGRDPTAAALRRLPRDGGWPVRRRITVDADHGVDRTASAAHRVARLS